tara:strand:- start:13993 stop:14514 length:522 start_codon:yes stop_codon:yes gene_type:complete
MATRRERDDRGGRGGREREAREDEGRERRERERDRGDRKRDDLPDEELPGPELALAPIFLPRETIQEIRALGARLGLETVEEVLSAALGVMRALLDERDEVQGEGLGFPARMDVLGAEWQRMGPDVYCSRMESGRTLVRTKDGWQAWESSQKVGGPKPSAVAAALVLQQPRET